MGTFTVMSSDLLFLSMGHFTGEFLAVLACSEFSGALLGLFYSLLPLAGLIFPACASPSDPGNPKRWKLHFGTGDNFHSITILDNVKGSL